MKPTLSYSKIIIIAICILLIGIPFHTAYADMGSKPTAEFDFIYETSEPLEIVEAALMECETSACLQAQPLEDMGPQHFTCDQGRCTTMSYGYADYLYLEITFSDGITRQSNMFSKENFDALYEVTVRPDDMVVVETGGQMNEMTKIVGLAFGGICLLMLLCVGLIAFIIIMIVRARRKK